MLYMYFRRMRYVPCATALTCTFVSHALSASPSTASAAASLVMARGCPEAVCVREKRRSGKPVHVLAPRTEARYINRANATACEATRAPSSSPRVLAA